jgi:hypothetical protein
MSNKLEMSIFRVSLIQHFQVVNVHGVLAAIGCNTMGDDSDLREYLGLCIGFKYRRFYLG